MSEKVADLMGAELGWNGAERSRQLAAFHSVASAYTLRRH
jgi:hypothetical protein